MSEERAVTKDLLIAARKRALRNGYWFKLQPLRRALLEAAIRSSVNEIKSPLVKLLIKEALRELEALARAFLLRALDVGYKVAARRVIQALKWGNKKALSWIRDLSYVFYLGVWNAYTSPIYRIV